MKTKAGLVTKGMVWIFAISLLLLSIGCGNQSNSAASSAPKSSAPVANPSATAAAASAAPAPSAAKPIPVKIGMAQVVLSFAAVQLADAAGLFTKHGLEPTFVSVAGGASHVALPSGDIDMQAIGFEIYLGQLARGDQVVAVQKIIDMSLDLNMSQKFIDAAKLPPNASLEERVKKLKGTKLAVPTIASPPDVFTRWLIKKYGGGLQPEKDVLIPGVGAPPQLIAAVEKGEIDGFLLSAPAGLQMDQRKLGKVYISHSEVPELKGITFHALTVMKKTMDANPEMVKRVVAAITEAQQILATDTAKAADILSKSTYYKQMDPVLLKNALDSIKDTFTDKGKMTQDGWKKAMDISKDMDLYKVPAAITENKDWTNQFIPN